MDGMPLRKILVVGSYDSFLKAGLRFASRFDAESDIVVVRARAPLSAAQLRDLGLNPGAESQRLGQVLQRHRLQEYDAVLLALAGRPSNKFIRRFETMWGDAPRRPLLVTLYPGLVFRFHYEGMNWRMGADLVLLNSPHDFEMYQRLCEAARVPHCNGLAGGLSLLSGERLPPRRAGGTQRVLFVGQPTVPTTREDRAALLAGAMDFARRYPNAEVLLRPRHRPGETTLHRTRYHLEEVLQDLGDTPSNFRITYEPLDALWDSVTLCVSVSSTAVLEALWRGIPSRVLTDFGVHENLGNQFFLGSGLLCPLSDLTPDASYVLDETWAERHVCGMDAQLPAITARLDQLLKLQEDSGAALAMPGTGDFRRGEAHWLRRRGNLIGQLWPSPSKRWGRLWAQAKSVFRS